MLISIRINGTPFQRDVEPRLLLVQFIRETCGLTGTHVGCDTSNCGACTVHLDGEAVYSCLVLAADCAERSVTTIEGLAPEGKLHPLQEAFIAADAFQCGFCTPGQILAAYALLGKHPDPTNAEIKEGMLGNLCRCTGYYKIIESIKAAAVMMQREVAP